MARSNAVESGKEGLCVCVCVRRDKEGNANLMNCYWEFIVKYFQASVLTRLMTLSK